MLKSPEGKRTKAALEPVISKHVVPGTTILTDGWSAYKDLEKLGNGKLMGPPFSTVCPHLSVFG